MSSKHEMPATVALTELQAIVVGPRWEAHRAYLVQLHITDPNKARAWLQELSKRVTWGLPKESRSSLSIAFTAQGVRAIGVPSRELQAFPRAFSEGMKRRAKLLGDPTPEEDDKQERATHALAVIHAPVIENGELFSELLKEGQWARSGATGEPSAPGDLQLLEHERDTILKAALPALDGVEILKVRALHRPLLKSQDKGTHDGKGYIGLEYFGFRDGVANPPLLSKDKQQLGDTSQFLIRGESSILDGGTYLVVRQLEQDVAAFWNTMSSASKPAALAEEMMGRTLDGAKLGDAAVSKCPFHAHAERVRPGPEKGGDGSKPVLLRRGMSYREGGQRGLMFMAINRDIEAQFEFIQRNWIQRGNHVGTTSTNKDPIAGLANQAGEESSFTCAMNGSAGSVRFKPFVSLKWGEYLFVPARAGLQKMLARASNQGALDIDSELADARSCAAAKLTTLASQKVQDTASGLQEVNLSGMSLAQIQAWMDDAATAPLFWRAVKAKSGLRVESRVFIAEPPLVEIVLRDDNLFSVAEYGRRMGPTLGPFFLGMDPHDPRYQREYPTVEIAREKPHDAQLVQTMACEAARKFIVAEHGRCDLARLEAPKTPFEFSVEQMCAVVIDNVLGQWFGVRGPTNTTLGITWGGALAQYFFRINASQDEARQASRAAWDYRRYLDDQVRDAVAQDRSLPALEESREHSVKAALRETLKVMQKAVEMPLEDHIRNLIGIVTGSLGATMKLFSEGMKHYNQARPQLDGKVERQALFPELIRAPLVRAQRGAPDAIYRKYVGKEPYRFRSGLVVQPGDEVVVWLGGSMQNDPPSVDDAMFGIGVHQCPARWMGIAMIEGMLQALTSLDGKIVERDGRLFFEVAAS